MKKDEQKAKSNDNNQVQGFVFGINLKGSEEVVMEGIKAFTHALTKGGGVLVTPTVRPVLPSIPTGKPKSNVAAAVVDQPEDELEQETAAEEEAVEEPVSESTNGNGSARPVRRPVPRTPDVLSDIDFNSDTGSLKDFITQKNPDDTYEKYATITVWYKEHAKVEEVNADRIYTAYRFMDWIPPNDVAQVLRDLKASKRWFDKGSGKGAYKINIIGLNKVTEGFNK